MQRPLIAVSAALEQHTTAFGPKDCTLLTTAYTNAIYAAGGQPVLLPVVVDPPQQLLAHMHGLVLTGGADLDPTLYGEVPDPSVYGVRRERDDFEAALYGEARSARMPVLAICRGMQLVNVLRGGHLIQNVVSEIPHWQKAPADRATHGLEVEPGSALAGVMAGEAAWVNSYHHQALRDVGHGMRVTARCGDVIEAVEGTEGENLLGVQWHPEHMAPTHRGQTRLFETFVKRAAEYSHSKKQEETKLCPTS